LEFVANIVLRKKIKEKFEYRRKMYFMYRGRKLLAGK